MGNPLYFIQNQASIVPAKVMRAMLVKHGWIPLFEITEDRLLELAPLRCSDGEEIELPIIYEVEPPSKMGKVGVVKPMGISVFLQEAGYDCEFGNDLFDEIVKLQITLVDEGRVCESRALIRPALWEEIDVWIVIPGDIEEAGDIKRYVADQLDEIPSEWELLQARYYASEAYIPTINLLKRGDAFVIQLRKTVGEEDIGD